MALSPQLLQFKSSGVYRLEFDKSITANIDVNTLRLIVGHSRKGPYNTPVLISNVEEFQNVFGTIDKKLEKKGMFFHRSAQEALSRGPILALNASSFTDGEDLGYYNKPATDASVSALTSVDGTKNYTDFFDNDKFMTPSDSRTLNALDAEGTNHAINFVNIKQSPITVFVRKAQGVKEFNITAREWYGEGNVPEFMNDFDYVSDFMVDVFVFKGNFDTTTASVDPVYGAYFNADGLLKDQLATFANLRQVTLEAQYTGSLIPGFKDLEGRNLYIESMVNGESRKTGLFCAIDEDAVIDSDGTSIDLVGHVATAADYELLSYVIKTGDNDRIQPYTFPGNNATSTTTYNQSAVTLPGTVALPIQTALGNTNGIIGNTLAFINFDPSTAFAVGDFLLDAAGTGYVEILQINSTAILCDGSINSAYDAINTTTDLDINKYEEVVTVAGDGVYNAIGTAFTVTYPIANEPTAFEISTGNYVGAESGRLALVERVSREVNQAGTEVTFTVYCDVEVPAAWSGSYLLSFEDATEVYKPFVLPGADLEEKEIQDCLSGLKGGNGIHAALTDKDLIDFRYVVDTFSSYDSNGIQNKNELASLAKDRQNASAILNAPTIADFKASSNPSFTDADGNFKVEYIATGGNLDKNPTALYSLPGITAGANYAFYYGPGLLVSDNGKDLIVPPAAYVSNNFIDKFTNATPWSIIAGPRRGVVGGSGLKGAEYAFDKSDRDVLEPFGINPIVFQRGVGLTILGNKTAQQSVKSALSSAHVREALIYIQEGIADILKDYVFEFNNTQTRLEIKTLADSFMEGVKADGGVYEFKNIMDQTNNTDDIIDQNYGIIDTYIEPVKGLEVVVHRTTILNTGEIETGNFN